MIGLVVLAVAASIMMLLLDSDVWQKIAVIAALWAAVLGLVLVSKYSNLLSAEKAKNRGIDARHQAELARVESAGREREAQLQSEFAQKSQANRDEQLELLRQELAQMRVQLAQMSGVELTPEQTAVRARAERIVELEQGKNKEKDKPAENTRQPASRGSHRKHEAPRSAATNKAASHTERRVPGFSTGSFAAVKWSGRDTSQDAQTTAQIPLVVDSTEVNKKRHAAQSEQDRAQAPNAQQNAQSQPSQSQPAQPQQASSPASPAQPGATADERHGRRRADESPKGLTVAELMARFKEKK